jgi:hypothetical protein
MVVASKVGFVLVMLGFFIVLGALCLFVTCAGWKEVLTVLCAGDFFGVEARFFSNMVFEGGYIDLLEMNLFIC